METIEYPEQIVKIHKDFLKASEESIALNELFKDEESKNKISRLKAIGFLSSKEVSAGPTDVEILKYYDLKYYREHFPFHRFISEDKVIETCKRHGLIVSSIGNFNGYVPNKNLKDIENFRDIVNKKIVKEDFKKYLYTAVVINGIHFRSKSNAPFKDRLKLIEWLEKDGVCYLEERRYSYDHSVSSGTIAAILNINSDFDIDSQLCLRSTDEPKNYFICAPANQLNLKGHKIEGYKTVKTSKGILSKVDDDPIVLCKVKHGYLIVTAWGNEASDVNVSNSIFN